MKRFIKSERGMKIAVSLGFSPQPHIKYVGDVTYCGYVIETNISNKALRKLGLLTSSI